MYSTAASVDEWGSWLISLQKQFLQLAPALRAKALNVAKQPEEARDPRSWVRARTHAAAEPVTERAIALTGPVFL